MLQAAFEIPNVICEKTVFALRTNFGDLYPALPETKLCISADLDPKTVFCNAMRILAFHLIF
jgi:hypothetical protein